LSSALAYYEKFAKDRKDDPLLRRQTAKAYFRVAQITREIDSHAKAIDAFRAAEAIWLSLVESDSNDHALASGLGECCLAIGKLFSTDENFPAATIELQKARQILERVAAENRSAPQLQATLADCYSEIGTVLSRTGKPNESLGIHDKAKVIQQAL